MYRKGFQLESFFAYQTDQSTYIKRISFLFKPFPTPLVGQNSPILTVQLYFYRTWVVCIITTKFHPRKQRGSGFVAVTFFFDRKINSLIFRQSLIYSKESHLASESKMVHSPGWDMKSNEWKKNIDLSHFRCNRLVCSFDNEFIMQ